MDEFESDAKSMAIGQAKMLRRRTTPEQLRDKKAHLLEELKRVEAAIKFLEENPTFEQGLSLISSAL